MVPGANMFMPLFLAELVGVGRDRTRVNFS
jgi:hypothetical protein